MAQRSFPDGIAKAKALAVTDATTPATASNNTLRLRRREAPMGPTHVDLLSAGSFYYINISVLLPAKETGDTDHA